MTPTQERPSRSLDCQIVLEEEEYTEALSKIIARDFFPSLVHLDATNGYLDALQTSDPHLINASVRRLEEITSTPASRRWPPLQTSSQTPFGLAGQTPSIFKEPSRKRARYETDMSLDNFQARYTSEDNSSFTQILDQENRVRKEKWAWAWDAQKRVENQQSRMIENRATMLIESTTATGVKEKFVIEAPKPLGLITAGQDSLSEEEGLGDEPEQPLVVAKKATEDVPLDVMAPHKDTRPAGVDGWKFKARNSLMFAPDADSSPYHRPESVQVDVNPKGVIYTSTRLPEHEHKVGDSNSISAPPSPTRSRIDAAITGTPYLPRSPQKQGFSLVPNIPSPNPAELGPAAVKHLMTWGTLNSTPRIISETDDPRDLRTPFHIPAITTREAVGHKLADNASKSLRTKADMLGSSNRLKTAKVSLLGKKGNMAPPSSTPRRAEASGNLTPAARRLLQRTTVGTAASRRAEVMERHAGWNSSKKGKERDLDRVRWTPTPTPVSRS